MLASHRGVLLLPMLGAAGKRWTRGRDGARLGRRWTRGVDGTPTGWSSFNLTVNPFVFTILCHVDLTSVPGMSETGLIHLKSIISFY